jgi:hypothetical protein
MPNLTVTRRGDAIPIEFPTNEPINLTDLTQANWYVDGSNISGVASDLNDGYTALTPLLTKRALSKRLGREQIRANMSVHLMSNEQAGDDGAVYCSTALFSLTYYGTMVQADTGTFNSVIAAVVPEIAGTGGTLATVQDNAKAANFWNTYATHHYLVEDTTTGARFRVHSGIGGSSAKISAPLTAYDPNSYDDLFLVTGASVVSGNTYTIWELPVHTFSGFETGLNVGLGLRNIILKSPTGALSFTTLPARMIRMSECGIDAILIASDAFSEFDFVNCWSVSGVQPGIGSWQGGILDGTFFPLSIGYVLDGDVIVRCVDIEPWAGVLQLGNVYTEVAIHTHAFEGGDVNGYSGINSISVAAFLYSARVWGSGSIRGHNGASIKYQDSAGSSFRVAGGLVLDGGVQAFTFGATGGLTSFRNVTTSNLDNAIGAGGFAGACQTVNGTRITLGA